MSTKIKDVDFIIYGGGITADIISIILDSENKQYCIVEENAKKQLENSPRSLALSQSSMNLLTYYGISFPFQEINEMRVFESGLDGKESKGELIFNNNEILGYVVKYNDIQKAILKKKKPQKIKLRTLNVLNVEFNNLSLKVTMSDGNEINANNIIFTKKINIDLLPKLNLSYRKKSYDQKAIVTTLQHKEGHEGIAYQYYDNGKPLALLPLKKSGVYYKTSLIWSLDDYLADDILANDDLTSILNNKLGHLYKTIKIKDEPISFPLNKFLLRGKADKRLIFVGDSIRMMHPMAGQAWNQSLRDISYLADALAESKNLGIDLTSSPSLGLLKRLRKLEGEGMTNSIDFINYIYNLDTSLSKGIRRNLMKVMNSFKPINKLIINEANGGIIRRPSLLMGEKPGTRKV